MTFEQQQTNRCHVCDDNGFIGKRRCDHSEATARAHRGAAMARANIRPTVDTTPHVPEHPPMSTRTKENR